MSSESDRSARNIVGSTHVIQMAERIEEHASHMKRKIIEDANLFPKDVIVTQAECAAAGKD